MKKTNVKVLALVCMGLVLGSSTALSDDWDDLATAFGVGKTQNGSNEKNVKEFYKAIGGAVEITDNGYRFTKNLSIDGHDFTDQTPAVTNVTHRNLALLYKKCGESSDGFVAFYQGWKSLVGVAVIGVVCGGFGFVGKGLMGDSDSSTQNNS